MSSFLALTGLVLTSSLSQISAHELERRNIGRVGGRTGKYFLFGKGGPQFSARPTQRQTSTAMDRLALAARMIDENMTKDLLQIRRWARGSLMSAVAIVALAVASPASPRLLLCAYQKHSPQQSGNWVLFCVLCRDKKNVLKKGGLVGGDVTSWLAKRPHILLEGNSGLGNVSVLADKSKLSVARVEAESLAREHDLSVMWLYK